ncbi:hypothetical protein GTY65_24375 [Streptomyces sp. SID8379]|uniref:hypothetical protein n=1 Tax=unclassified Streptomyces TaxID=2593676 RepID=UPI0003814B0F|nr:MULTISPECIES: hypothetical protein [unclassified Streptomyces]MYW67179.1 hypothetical protein [Streptomyces sp. SID8379]
MASVLIAAAVLGTSACGGEAKAQKKPAAKPKTMSVQAAAEKYQDVVASRDCDTMEPGSCWGEMENFLKSARQLRKSMNADKSVDGSFYSEAYTLIDTMEEGFDVGEDLGGAQEGESIDAAGVRSNRDEVFGSGNDLSEWLDQHPTK